MFILKSDLVKAREIALKFNNPHITMETLFYGLLDRQDFVLYLKELDEKVSIENVKKVLQKHLDENKSKAKIKEPLPSFKMELILKKSMATSLLVGERNITFHELFNCIEQEDDAIFINNFVKKINSNRKEHGVPTEDEVFLDDLITNGVKKMNKENKMQEFLKYTTHLNDEITTNPFSFSMAVARDTELKELERVLLRKNKNSVILTGEPGVGKSNLIDSFVHNIVTNKVHDDLKDVQIYMLNIHKLLSDIKFHGILEARLSDIIDVLQEDRNKILFIDELHMLYNAGGNNANLDIMNFLKAPMSKNKIRIIGATTNAEYRRYVEKNSAFTRRFCHIDISEPTVSDTIVILNNIKSSYEDYYDIKISDEIVSGVVNLTHSYIKNRYNPDKSFDILDSTLARKRLNNSNEITMTDVYEEISKECRIPSDELSKNKSEQLEHLKSRLNTEIIGQGHIFNDIIDTLYVSSAGLKEEGKPMGSFLFQGQTSSGKTISAQIIADTLNIPLLRYDMSAFQERHTVSTLIGSPPGYVGYSDGAAGSGKLISDIEKNPHCVLLFDEIEKAHPEVLNILLQIMDYGKLTSSSGKDAYFSKVILIMTSNLGSQASSKSRIGFGKSNDNDDIIDENVNMFLAPEFRARLDGILKFKSLGMDELGIIAKNYIDKFIKEVLKHNIILNYNDEIFSHIAKKSIDSKLNARYIQGYISKSIKTQVSRLILENSSSSKPITKTMVLDNDTIILK